MPVSFPLKINSRGAQVANCVVTPARQKNIGLQSLDTKQKKSTYKFFHFSGGLSRYRLSKM